MNYSNPIFDITGDADIYLIDQIMKGRYHPGERILDAGCGSGRNLHWFIQNELLVYGIDRQAEAIAGLREEWPFLPIDRFQVAGVEALPFDTGCFDHVICSAVLHFAGSTALFHAMMTEMLRVLRPQGSLFIRMASDIGIENQVRHEGDGVYLIPDGSRRFLLTRDLLSEVIQRNRLAFLEPLKTTNVNDLRCMSTLVLTRTK